MSLTQAEIDALLSGGGTEALPDMPENTLTAEEIDTLGEVGNMCMGAMATTMYTLLDRRVEITTPRVTVLTSSDVLSMYQVPFVVVEVEYTEGISGKNLLLLKEYDAALITDILMGGDGSVAEPVELDELHMSAINEIMNQMIGASATALSQLISTPVNISTPESRRMTLNSDGSGVLESEDLVILITFDMEMENLLKSQLVQLIPYEQGRELSAMLQSSAESTETVPARPAAEAPPPVPPEAPAPSISAAPVDVRPMQYDAFPSGETFSPPPPAAMSLVQDIPLQVSVELGRTKKEISQILEFDMGTVVVLDKAAGDPVEILVNGKLVAYGEVVVIDENYGVRITQLCG